MPDEPAAPSPDTPPRFDPQRRAATGLAGETTRAVAPGGDTRRSDGGTILPASPVPLREVIGDFEILGKLGQGGMGAVYRARQRSLQRDVALKILPASLADDAEFVSRFQREARVAASLSHANLVKVYTSGQADGSHFIAMELIEGETLGDWLRRGALPPLEAVRITLDVARALDCGWRRAQLIHRDIKPGNIFLSIHGDVKLGDLGLAKTADGNSTGLTQTGTAMGTPHYISPEQARGDKELDFRADIYSLGCTLYQMLTGRTPYEGSTPLVVMGLHRDAPPPAILKVMPQCPLPLARLVSKMLKKQRRERISSYEELIGALESVQSIFAPAVSPLEAFRPPMAEAEPPGASDDFPKPAAPRTAPALALPKSKLPLYGGIGVMALGLVAFLAWPKPEKLTKAQLYAQEHTNDLKATATSDHGAARTVASPGAAQAGPGRDGAPEPGAIRLWNAPGRFPAASNTVWEDGAVCVDHNSLQYRLRPNSDMIFRAAIRMNSDSISLAVRTSGERNLDYYSLGLATQLGQLTLRSVHAGKTVAELHKWRLPRAYGPDEWLRLEVRALGDQLTVLVDDQPLGTVQDASIPGPGGVMIYAGTKGWFRDIVYVPLDKPDRPTVLAANPGNWVDRLKTRKWQTPWSLENGVLKTGAKSEAHALATLQDGAIRVRARATQSTGIQLQLLLRNGDVPGKENTTGNYQFQVNLDGTSCNLLYFERRDGVVERNETLWRNAPLPPIVAGQKEMEWEFRAVGDEFSAWVNGQFVNSAHHTGVPKGIAALVSDVGVEISKIETIDFTGLIARERSRPSAATYPQPPAWTDVTANLRSGYLAKGLLEVDGEWLKTTSTRVFNLAPNLTLRNPIVRIRFFHRADIWLRRMRTQTDDTTYSGGIHADWAGIALNAKASTKLTETSMHENLEGEHEAVFAAQGDTLTMWLDGKQISTVQDQTLASGEIGLFLSKADLKNGDGRIKKVEYGELPDRALAAVVRSPSTEPWQDVLHDPAKLLLTGGMERTPEGLRLTNPGAALCRQSHRPQRDGAVRMRAAFGGLRPELRERVTDAGFYNLIVNDAKTIVVRRWDQTTRQATTLRSFPLPEAMKPGQEYELELGAMGQTLTAKLDGVVLGSVTDATLTEGIFGIGASEQGPPSLVTAFDVLDLDAAGGPNAVTTPAVPEAAK